MKVRADIAEMLREGLTDRQIELRAHVCHTTAAAARRALGLPKCRAGRKSEPTLAEALANRSRAVLDGHRVWTGQFSGPCPVLRYRGVRTTAYRAAFIVHHGGPPVGVVQPGCGESWCVAPQHMDDRPARERNRAAYKALFGGLQ